MPGMPKGPLSVTRLDLTWQISDHSTPTRRLQEKYWPDLTPPNHDDAESWIFNISIRDVVKFILKMQSLENMACTKYA